MNESSAIVNDSIFLALAAVSAACILVSCFTKRARWSVPAFLAGAATCGAAYFMLDAFYCGVAHIALFGGGGLIYSLLKQDERAHEAEEGDRPKLAGPLAVSIALFGLLVFVSFSLDWDAAAGGWGGGFSVAAIIGDSMASRWVLAFAAAAVLIGGSLAGSFLILKGGARK